MILKQPQEGKHRRAGSPRDPTKRVGDLHPLTCGAPAEIERGTAGSFRRLIDSHGPQGRLVQVSLPVYSLSVMQCSRFLPTSSPVVQSTIELFDGPNLVSVTLTALYLNTLFTTNVYTRHHLSASPVYSPYPSCILLSPLTYTWAVCLPCCKLVVLRATQDCPPRPGFPTQTLATTSSLWPLVRSPSV